MCLYVDDLIFTGNDDKMMQSFKEHMMKAYEMSDLGLLHYFLGIEVTQKAEGIFVSQKRYAKSILEKFNMSNCKPVSTPLVVSEKLSSITSSGMQLKKVKLDYSIASLKNNSLIFLQKPSPKRSSSIYEIALELSNKCIKGECWN